MDTAGADFTGSITILLRRAREGDRQAEGDLFSRVYPELRRVAQSLLSHQHRPTSGEGDGTALVHDACCRLLAREQLTAEDRRHFYFLLGRAMSDELAEQARAEKAIKRGGDHRRVAIDMRGLCDQKPATDRLEVRDAIEKFRAIDPDGAQIAELRCIYGLSLDATAAALHCSVAVVRRNWSYAKAWLTQHLAEGGNPGLISDPESDRNP